MQFSKALLIFGAILALTFAYTKGDTLGDARYLRLMTGLKHGDSCSYELEELRQNSTGAMVGSDIYTKLRQIQAWKQTVLRRGENFCSALKLLVCSKDTSTCVCGDAGKKAMGLLDYPSDYTTEVVNSETKCRWSEGSSCTGNDMPVPENMRSMMGDSRCATGTTCKTTTQSRDCTFMSVFLYALTKGIRSERRLAMDIFNGAVCKCQSNTPTTVNPAENEIFEGYNRFSYRSDRQKRAVEQMKMGESDLYAISGIIPSNSAIF